MSGWRVAAATLAVLLACTSGEGELDGLTKAQRACDQACTDPAQGGSVRYVGGMLCGERWTCRCALPGEPEESVCDPIVRVGVIGDTRLAGDATEPAVVFAGEAVGLMTAWRPHLLAHVGDLVGDQRDYSTYLDTLLAALDLSGVPRLLTLGEHDVGGSASIEVIRSAFPADASSWLEPGQFYGSVDLEGVHFVVLDVTYQQLEPATHLPPVTLASRNGYVPQAQREWLAADLSATKLPIVIFLHTGTGVWNTEDSTTRLSNAPALMAIFEAHRGQVAAVINGHANAPLNKTVNGIHYFTVAAMIPERYEITPHDRGNHAQLEIDTERHTIVYTVWENDSAKGYLEVQRLELPF